jgi:hypothetical protein
MDSIREAQQQMAGVVMLGGEIIWGQKEPEFIRATINWGALERQGFSYGIALRIAPYPGSLIESEASVRFIATIAKSVLDEAKAHNLNVSEFQLDFDCAQKNLPNYRAWLPVLRQAIYPTHFVITTLPSWLNDPEFIPLLREADGYVLQVHSVPTSNTQRASTLCEATLARKWVAKAAKLGLPFSVALPTYRCSAGYNATGKLLSVAMDSVQPAWPAGTRVLEFAANTDEMAMLVKEWQQARPTQLREIIWYRLPVATDIRNWRWVTLSAVMSGRRPLHHLEVLQEGENPIDLSIVNTGEADEQLDSVVTATWTSATVMAADALAGWTVDVTNGRAIFRTAAERQTRLSPGGKRQIGWLRYEQPVSLQLELAKKE